MNTRRFIIARTRVIFTWAWVCWLAGFTGSGFAAEINPFSAGEKYAAAKDYRRAIASFSEAIDLNLRRSSALIDRAYCYEQTHDLQRASADYRMATQAAPKSGLYQYLWGAFLYRTKDRRGAIAAYRKAIQLEPAIPIPHNDLAWLLATSPDAAERDGKQSIKEAWRACELSHWKAPQAIDTLSAAYAEVGQFQEAVANQQRALELLKANQTRGAQTLLYRQHLTLFLHQTPIRSQI